MSQTVTVKMTPSEHGFSASTIPEAERDPIVLSEYELSEQLTKTIGGTALSVDLAPLPAYTNPESRADVAARLRREIRDERASKRTPEARSYRRRRALGSIGITTATASLAVSLYWSADVLPARDAIAHTESSTEFVAHARDPLMEKNLIIITGGVGTLDASPLAATMPFNEVGQVAAERYDQAGFDYEEMAENAVDYAESHGVENISLYSHSAGGPIGIGMAAKIRPLLEKINLRRMSEGANEPIMKLVAIIIDRSPDGQLSIQPTMRTLAGRLSEVASLIPGCDVARVCRYAAEMYSRKNQFITNLIPDVHDFFQVSKNVIDRKFSGHTPSGKLVEAEVNAINEYQVRRNMKILGETLSTQPRLLIGNLEPAGGNSDPVVIGPRARKNWRQLTLENAMLWLQADEPSTIGHQTALQQPEMMAAVMHRDIFPELLDRIGEVANEEAIAEKARLSQVNSDISEQVPETEEAKAIAAGSEH